MPNECVHPDLQEIEDFDFVKDCAVPIAPPPILGSPSDLQLDPMPPLPSSGSVIQIGDGEGGGGTISGVITGNVASRATGGSPLDELTGWLYAANDTGLVIETLSSGTRVIATLDAELLQRGVVSPDDQRFLGDKRVVQSDPLGGTGWSVSSFTDVRGDAFPTGYTLKDGDQLRPKSLTGGAILPEGSVYFWAEHRSFGVALKADSGGGGSGLASDWGYVRPLTHPGEAYAGHHTSASAGDKAAEVVHGAGLTQPYSNDVDTSSHTGYYPAFSIYTASRYAEEGSTTARLWIGADVTPSHERIGLTRGYPSDQSTGLAEFHFRKQTWEPDVPGVPPSPPTPTLSRGDMLISRLHLGLDATGDYPGAPRELIQTAWPNDATLPTPSTDESAVRFWVERGGKLWPGLDNDADVWPSGEKYPYEPVYAGGVLIGYTEGVAPVTGSFDPGGEFDDTGWTSAGDTGAMDAGRYHFTGALTSYVGGVGTDGLGCEYLLMGRFWNVTQGVAASLEFGLAHNTKFYQILTVDPFGVPTYAAPSEFEGFQASAVCAIIEVDSGDVIEFQAKTFGLLGGTPLVGYIGDGTFGGGVGRGASHICWHRIR